MDDRFVSLGEEVILTLLWQSGASESATVCFVISLSICYWLLRVCALEVFTEDLRPEDPGPDPGPIWVQPGPGRVPIYYFGSRVFLTLCVIPESIGEHRTCQRSASVNMRVCNLQFVKLGWEKCEREIRWKKKKRVTSAARNRARAELMLVLQTDGDHGFLHEWCEKKQKKMKRRTCYWTRT